MSFDKPSPEIVPSEQEIKEASKKKLTCLYIAIAAIVMMCLAGFTLAAGYQLYRMFVARDEEAEIGVPVIEQTTSPTKGNIEIPTGTPQNDEVLQTIKSWTVALDESYDDNALDWFVGDVDDDFVTMTISIENGEYLWDGISKQNVVWRVWLDDSYADFALSVEARNIGDNTDAQYGLVFRQIEGQYYLFDVRDTGFFEVYKFQEGEWIELIPLTESDTIIPGQPNKLMVVAWDGWFSFYINDIFVGRIVEGVPPEGVVGLVIGISNEGESYKIAFDNLTVRVP